MANSKPKLANTLAGRFMLAAMVGSLFSDTPVPMPASQKPVRKLARGERIGTSRYIPAGPHCNVDHKPKHLR